MISNKEKKEMIERRIEVLNFEISDLLAQQEDIENFLPRTPEQIVLLNQHISDQNRAIEALTAELKMI